MRVFYDFRCTNGHIFEEYVESGCYISRCGCGANAKRIITPVNFHLDGSDTGYPTAADKWARDHVRGAKTKREA